MSSDISRQTFDPTKHYSKVIMQQGRVQLDADWNEQQDIIQHRNKLQTLDMIGPNGAPGVGGGFKLTFTPGNHDFLISPGRIYIDGILCELQEFTAVATQGFHKHHHGVQVPLWPVDGRSWMKGEWIELLDDRERRVRIFQIRDVVKEHSDEQADCLVLVLDTNFSNPRVGDADQKKIQTVRRILTYCTQPPFPDSTSLTPSSDLPQLVLEDDQILLFAYLDVWERQVTALEDTRLREVALDGPETTTRLQTTWRVRILPIKITDNKIRRLVEEECKQQKEQPRHYGELYAERADLSKLTSGRDDEKTRRLKAIESELATIDQRVNTIIDYLNGFDCNTPIPEWDALLASPTGKLTATTYDAANPRASGYRGLQNQLYRVEIHETDADGMPLVFKWAHNNASLTMIVEVQDNTVLVPDAGQGGILNFSRGQYIEVLREDGHDPHTVSGPLLQITMVDTLANRLTLDSSPGDNNELIRIRLWDSAITIADQYKGKTWESMPLEEGITIQFSQGTFCNGDYWLIAARTSTREIEWPPYHRPNTTPVPRLRFGVQHHYSRLARIRLFQGQGQHYDKTIRDCRIQFTPLPRVVNAMHIKSINWDNDALLSRKRFHWREHESGEGLKIELDWEPHGPSIRPATLIVTLETNLPGGGEGSFIMHGHIEVQGTTITWHWLKHEGRGFLAELFEKSDDWYRDVLGKPEYYARVRVTLKGHAIWGYRDHHTINLDGQALARPGGFDQQLKRERAALSLPSGDGMRASDFESWFYIRE